MTHSDSNGGLARQDDPFKGMWVAGWITSTQTPDGLVHYGPFDTQELALKWGKELTNVEVYRVFVPSFNAGQEHHDYRTERKIAGSLD